MRYFGIFILICAVFLIWRCYCGYVEDEAKMSRAFLFALRDYREKIKCYLISPSEWASGYGDEALRASGFTDKIKSGETMITAYLDTRSGMYLPMVVDEALKSCFMRLGEGDAYAEVETLESTIAVLEGEVKTINEQLPKRQKAVGALLGACAVGVVILMI